MGFFSSSSIMCVSDLTRYQEEGPAPQADPLVTTASIIIGMSTWHGAVVVYMNLKLQLRLVVPF
jgi:hypothetical protein